MPQIVAADAPAQMPTTWALTGAVLVGLSAYGAMRAATGEPRTSPVSMGLSVGDQFPPSALAKCGVSGKNAVVFFYGADDAPSCSKEISAFENELATFAEAGVAVVGVRNGKGVKESVEESTSLNLVVDDEDEMRAE